MPPVSAAWTQAMEQFFPIICAVQDWRVRAMLIDPRFHAGLIVDNRQFHLAGATHQSEQNCDCVHQIDIGLKPSDT